jgi:hypothetical protein
VEEYNRLLMYYLISEWYWIKSLLINQL